MSTVPSTLTLVGATIENRRPRQDPTYARRHENGRIVPSPAVRDPGLHQVRLEPASKHQQQRSRLQQRTTPCELVIGRALRRPPTRRHASRTVPHRDPPWAARDIMISPRFASTRHRASVSFTKGSGNDNPPTRGCCTVGHPNPEPASYVMNRAASRHRMLPVPCTSRPNCKLGPVPYAWARKNEGVPQRNHCVARHHVLHGPMGRAGLLRDHDGAKTGWNHGS
jgi:hypothetical protein